MTEAAALPDFLARLHGRVRTRAPLAPTTWFRAGGTAEFLVRPADAADLCRLLAGVPEDVRLTVIGAGSNVLVRDGGIEGVTIRLGGGFAEVTPEPDGMIAGAACPDARIAEHAAAGGLGGLEFLSGIPGSLGGAVAMNAGAYGSDLASVLDWVEVATPHGLLRLDASRLAFAYRHAALPSRGVVVRARLRAAPADPALIDARMERIRASRTATQPVGARTGGSTFRNPDPSESSYKAWELIDAAGCRGLTLGDAQVSGLHCNFLINRGQATATDLETLAETVRARVRAASGVTLHWEIRRLGRETPVKAVRGPAPVGGAGVKPPCVPCSAGLS
jgi:UDP-N-acetylmuramate dehydrogenase